MAKLNNSEPNLHKGHRARMRRQLAEGKIGEGSPPHVLLEMLLYHSIPQGDTNPLAHKLINRFGSLEGVLSASYEDLLKVEGVGEITASLIKLYKPITRRIILERIAGKNELHGGEEIGNYILNQYAFCSEERVSVLCLRGNGKIIAFEDIGSGDIASVGISTRRILEIAIKYDAGLVVLAHNHPSGLALPSAIDVEITRGLVATLRQVGVHLIDHVVVAGHDYVSMAQSEEYSGMF